MTDSPPSSPAPQLDGASSRLAGAAPAMAVASAATVAVWLGAFVTLAPLEGMNEPVARLVFALKCGCVVVLLTFLPGIEAVAHERLASTAFDPLAGHESRRLKVNGRYLQNTLEQLVLFFPGLLALAAYSHDGAGLRGVVATSVTFVLSRFAFWVGYHREARHRIVGLTGMVQSMIVLLYVSARFGYEVAGVAGAAAPLAAFGAIEVFLVAVTRRPPRQGG